MNAFWGKLMSSVFDALCYSVFRWLDYIFLVVLRNKWKRHRYHGLDGRGNFRTVSFFSFHYYQDPLNIADAVAPELNTIVLLPLHDNIVLGGAYDTVMKEVYLQGKRTKSWIHNRKKERNSFQQPSDFSITPRPQLGENTPEILFLTSITAPSTAHPPTPY